MASSRMLRREALMALLTRVTQRNFPEDAILHSQRRENLKSYREASVVCRARWRCSSVGSKQDHAAEFRDDGTAAHGLRAPKTAVLKELHAKEGSTTPMRRMKSWTF
jgi:hypothetical protein